MKDQALHIVGKIGERNLCLGAFDADRADKQRQVCPRLCRDMLDPKQAFDPVGSAQCL